MIPFGKIGIKHFNMADFTIEEIQRYSRQFMLEEIGAEGQIKIKHAKVLVVGTGGLGCPVLQYLAAAGVGTIGIVDFDKVEIHNLHRQILFGTDDIGKSKASTAAKKILSSNSNVNPVVFDVLLDESNAENIISQFDIVVDGSDNFQTRYLVNDVCVILHKPLVYGSILKFEGQIAVFNFKGGKNLRDIFPEAPNPEDVPSCSQNGVLGIVPGMIGMMLCDLCLKIILDFKIDMNTLMLINLKNYHFQKLVF